MGLEAVARLSKIALFLLLSLCPMMGTAQERRPFIELFRPLYLTSGLPLTEKPTKENADVKFQVGLEIPVWRDMCGSGVDLTVAYTQISLWNLYAESSPFYDNTYIPGVYGRKVWKDPESRPVHSLLWGLEHRSNGRDDAYSRSYNYAMVTYARTFSFGLTLEATARYGVGWYGDDFAWDLGTKYFGVLQGSLIYTTPGKGWEFMLSATPLWNRSIANVNVEAARRIGRRNNNPYLFVQFHYGYDEALRDWLKDSNGSLAPRAMLRFGLLLTPHNFMRGCL